MNTKTIYLTGAPTLSSYTINMAETSIKGTTNVIFDFDSIVETTFPAVKMKASYGDTLDVESYDYDIIKNHIGTGLTYKIAKYGKFGNVLDSLSYIYSPSDAAYFTSLTATFLVTFSNFTEITFRVPIKIARDSYYSALGNIHLIDTQIVSNSANSVFAIIQTEDGNAINIVLS